MRHYIGLGMLVLSLPLILSGVLDLANPLAVIVGVALAGAGILVFILGRDDRRRKFIIDGLLSEPDPPRLRNVSRPPPLPKVSVDTTGVAAEMAACEPQPERRAETMLPPPVSNDERRAGIRLVHTDGRRLVLRNRPRRTG